MFKVNNVILAEDIATAKFACNLPKCKGACCVVGDAGAPVSSEEIPVLRKAYRLLKDELRPGACEVVENEGLIQGNNKKGYELACTDGKECVFVTYTDDGIAHCAIQEAFLEGRMNWEKPLSCHLFPIRLKRIAGMEYASFEYVDRLCSAACEKGEREGIYLSEFLKKPLIRRYGEEWFEGFKEACEDIRTNKNEAVESC